VRLMIMQGCAWNGTAQRCRDARRQREVGRREAMSRNWTVHNQRPLRNCIKWSDGRKRNALTVGDRRDFSIFSFMARSAST